MFTEEGFCTTHSIKDSDFKLDNIHFAVQKLWLVKCEDMNVAIQYSIFKVHLKTKFN